MRRRCKHPPHLAFDSSPGNFTYVRTHSPAWLAIIRTGLTLCAGVLLKPNELLTASWCLERLPRPEYLVDIRFHESLDLASGDGVAPQLLLNRSSLRNVGDYGELTVVRLPQAVLGIPPMLVGSESIQGGRALELGRFSRAVERIVTRCDLPDSVCAVSERPAEVLVGGPLLYDGYVLGIATRGYEGNLRVFARVPSAGVVLKVHLLLTLIMLLF